MHYKGLVPAAVLAFAMTGAIASAEEPLKIGMITTASRCN